MPLSFEVVSSVRKYELVGFGIESVDHSVPETEFDAQPLLRDYSTGGLAVRASHFDATWCCVVRTACDLPFDQPKKIDAILPFQLEEVIPFDIESVVYDYQILQTREDNTHRVRICARDDITQLLEFHRPSVSIRSA